MNGINLNIDGILGRSFMKAQAPHQTSKYALFKKASEWSPVHVQPDSTFSLVSIVSLVSLQSGRSSLAKHGGA